MAHPSDQAMKAAEEFLAKLAAELDMLQEQEAARAEALRVQEQEAARAEALRELDRVKKVPVDEELLKKQREEDERIAALQPALKDPLGKPAQDNAAFRQANRYSRYDHVGRYQFIFPMMVHIVFRPAIEFVVPTLPTHHHDINHFYSHDPINVYLDRDDPPVAKIRNTIRELLPQEEADYLFSLPEFIIYTNGIGRRFWRRYEDSTDAN
jgi:hypothetical protein